MITWKCIFYSKVFLFKYIKERQDVMKKRLFYIVFGLILIATLRFYYIGFKNGFDNLPVITDREINLKVVIPEQQP